MTECVGEAEHSVSYRWFQGSFVFPITKWDGKDVVFHIRKWDEDRHSKILKIYKIIFTKN
jgi:hypothetical protein